MNDQRSSAARRIAAATARAIEPGRLRLREGEPAANAGSSAGTVADLAGISVDWYVRLEQGRESLPSKATVGALAKALRLSSTECAHVYARICHRCRCDLLCWNEAAVKLFRDFSKVAVAKRNTAAPVVQLA
jgi:transcriptional regulator with XRE-family HTH domain